MNQKGFSLIEVIIVCAVGSIYIMVGYAWYVSLSQTVDRDTRRNTHLQELETVLSRYTAYEDIAGKDTIPVISTTGTTTTRIMFTDIDRVTSKIKVSVSGQNGMETVEGEKIFSHYIAAQSNPWCGFVMGTLTDFNVQDSLVIPSANLTAIVPYDQYLIVASNTTTLSDPDMYVVDMIPTMRVVASLHTGSGITALATSGRYVYAANTSAVSQLQVIDFISPTHPSVVSEFKVALPTATTSPPDPSALAYNDGFVYIGTEKWSGPEVYMINVMSPLSPQSFLTTETNSMVQDIVIDGQSIFVALSADPQFAEYRVQDSMLKRVWSFTPSGASVQEGKRISVLPRSLALGRTVGGFNIVTNHELFVMNRTTNPITLATSTDIGSGTYGMITSGSTILSAIGGVISYLGRVEDYTKSVSPVGILPLTEKPKAVTCIGASLIALGQQSITRISP